MYSTFPASWYAHLVTEPLSPSDLIAAVKSNDCLQLANEVANCLHCIGDVSQGNFTLHAFSL